MMKLTREASAGLLVAKFSHGIEVLQFLKRSSPSQFRVLVAGVLGAGMGMAGLIMAMRRSSLGAFLMNWTSEGKDSSEVSLSVAGLQNLGNNCFLNVVLQALASCNHFYPYLQDMLNADDSEIKEWTEKMPLTFALVSLLKDLCIIREERPVLSPRKVMNALDLYITGFNLTRQQDAAEALLHLLSSLEEERSECYMPHITSLVDILALTSNHSYRKDGRQNDFRRWQKQIVGPFDGTIGSMLTCASCSSQLSMDFEVVRCLPLTPVLDGNAAIMYGCTVADCLKQFTAPEHLQNYRCSRCWHITALKFLSLKAEENKARIEMISQCVKPDSCDCKDLFLHEMTQPAGYSCALKQLCIVRCPKILCLHLQRASMNEYGELIKLKGHVSFPLVLDLFPFTIGAKKLGFRNMDENEQRQGLPPHLSHFNMQLRMQMAPYTKSVGYNRDILLGSNAVSSKLHNFEAAKGGSSVASKNFMYRLASVAEHYARFGSGHYAAYRRLTSLFSAENIPAESSSLDQHWVYVSDREVSNVSLETVLAAEASLLIYERIEADS